MIYTEEQLKRQQIIMKHFGHYRGRIDGIWGRSSIKAKRAFEFDTKVFSPAYPNRGLPLDHDAKLPKGIIRDPMNRNLLTHISFDEDRIAELMGEGIKKVEKVAVEKKELPKEENFVPQRVPDEGRPAQNPNQNQKKKHKHMR